MPLHARGRTRQARWELFLRGQAPFIVMLVLIAPLVVVSRPEGYWAPVFVAGIAVAAVSTVLALVVPWERQERQTIVIVPLLDLVSAALIHETAYDSLPPSFLLAAFPVLWLGYGFRRWGLPLAVAGAFLVSLFPLAWRGEVPGSAVEWGRAMVIPLCAALAAVWLHYVSHTVRRHAIQAERAAGILGSVELELEDRKVLTSAITATIDVGVVFYGADGDIRHINPAGEEIFRIASKPFGPGTESATFVFGPDRLTPIEPDRQIIPRALRGEHVVNELEWIGPSGSQRAVLLSSRAVIRGDGSRLGTVVTAHDVTQLAQAVQVREDFLLSVSHELRTPLTSIVGYVDLLSDSLDVSSLGIEREFEVIRRNADLLLVRIADLLALPDSEVEIESARTDVSGLVERSVEDIRPRAEANAVTVSTFVAPPVVADVDESRFRQVIDNLLSNAVKYTPPGGTATLTVREVDGQVELAVADTGVGMAADEVAQIFDPLYRARQARDGATGGFGIGLSIVQRIVTAHGGTIDVASEPGTGTTVTVRVPSRIARSAE
ncbi:PAS domain-containing sensor histidine kinase [Labedella endophytica]|nr:ATP-binding protein [Labedella endophytica]